MGLIENFGRVADTYIREKERLTSADVERVREQTGHPFWPSEVLRDTIIFLAMLAVLCFYSWIVPPPLHNSADPFAQAGFVFPDWYVLFSYGYLRWAEYLPQFDVPLGPIGGFFGQPVFPWNAAWWGSMLTGIPVGILILPPLLGGRAQRGVENPWAATLGAHGKCCASACITIDARHRDTGDADFLVELARYINRILAGHGVGYQ